MSYITQYKSTLESQLKGKSNRVLIVDENGFNKISNLYSQEELLTMNLLGLLKIEDKDILKADNLYENEIILFVGIVSIDKTIQILNKTKTHVYIFSYDFLSEKIIEKIKKSDTESRICKISHGSLDFYPTSEKSVIGKDVFSVIKNKPVKIEYHKNFENLQQFVEQKIQTSLNNCAIREKEENILLYVLERNYDEITPLITPWRYQSLINYLNIEIGSVESDTFFAHNKFLLYNEITDELNLQSSNLKKQKQNVVENIDKFELEEKTRLISKHVEICGTIQKHITKQKLLEKSTLEQKALIGTANSAELKELAIANNELYKLLMNGTSVTLKGFINTLNFIGENSERSTFHQYISPLRNILQKLKTNYSKYSKIYVYINDYICYEEIAEILLENKHKGPRLYLLSDNIKGNIYPALTSNKFERTNDILRILQKEFKKQETVYQNVYYGEIEDKINYLIKHNSSFLEEENSICENIKTTLPILLTREFTKLKSEKPKNKLEKNINNIKLSKLSKLSTEFGKFEKSDRITNEIMVSFDKKFTYKNTTHDELESKQLLLKNEEELQLNKLEQEIERREESITNIYENTLQIHSMFVEVNALVAKQTLMLGSISENVINACDLVEDGNIQLIKAEEHQKNANNFSNKLIAGLFGLCVLMGIGVGIKESITNK